ncbi:HAD domain-containing protein [Lewinella sp. 4G2]|uniref:HAD domain-containing protein n=1 Tax=Lewinella sp. 4G2 TaxID=1803372 RepID=UPI0007B4B1D7|nr:HAD domain-containing protein [Lewinella sp. 4G2]OAV45086.1 hypothetical protein A3850_011570 [Lewinella sp. 4G2]
MKQNILILDLDGVLITTPSWRPDEMDTDGYSKFNAKAVENLNILLAYKQMEIWLVSSRRASKPMDEFNKIFKSRGICQPIAGYVAESNSMSRMHEIENFLDCQNHRNALILDDDKSLRDFKFTYKGCYIDIDNFKGFDEVALAVALELCDTWE